MVVGAGQSGLAAARALLALDQPVVVLEAADAAGGSWPRYYDSLRLFSPAEFSAMPGLAFAGDPDRYPARDEVATYLRRYADTLGVEIQTGVRVTAVEQTPTGFLVHTDSGTLVASGVVAATGAFSNPYRPEFAAKAVRR